MTATFGAGCFWGVEAAFRKVPGVIETSVGFMGGTDDDASYEEVCSGTTGHAEVCKLEYDPSVVSYEQLLDVFWSVHDPTQLDRQGPDVGTQYRSAIFFCSDEQRESAERSKQALARSGEYEGEIVTQIETASFYIRAEEYHQRYYEKNGIESCPI